MPTRIVRRVLLAGVVWLAACASGATQTVAEFPSQLRGQRLALILTGDDGVTSTIESLATHLAREGVPSVVLTPDGDSDSPDGTSASIDRIVRAHLRDWSRQRLLVLGTARGAGIAPFVANRMGEDLRDRVEGIVLFGVQSRVSFRYRWHLPWRVTPRPTDLPVLPELERLRGFQILCLYRDAMRDTFCPSLDPTLARRELAPDKGDGEREGAALAARVTRFLPAP